MNDDKYPGSAAIVGGPDPEPQETAGAATQIVDRLSENEVRKYLTYVIEALYCHEADGQLDLDKEWSPDELDELGRLLEPLFTAQLPEETHPAGAEELRQLGR